MVSSAVHSWFQSEILAIHTLVALKRNRHHVYDLYHPRNHLRTSGKPPSKIRCGMRSARFRSSTAINTSNSADHKWTGEKLVHIVRGNGTKDTAPVLAVSSRGVVMKMIFGLACRDRRIAVRFRYALRIAVALPHPECALAETIYDCHTCGQHFGPIKGWCAPSRTDW